VESMQPSGYHQQYLPASQWRHACVPRVSGVRACASGLALLSSCGPWDDEDAPIQIPPNSCISTVLFCHTPPPTNARAHFPVSIHGRGAAGPNS
jgi:hypothetical protein